MIWLNMSKAIFSKNEPSKGKGNRRVDRLIKQVYIISITVWCMHFYLVPEDIKLDKENGIYLLFMK
jgi:hypothetical protein